MSVTDAPYQSPPSAIDGAIACIPHSYSPVLKEPEVMNFVEHDLYLVNPDDHLWRTQYFNGLPLYLLKYFAGRYKAIFEKKGRGQANTFLREKMEPAAKRARMVLAKYKKLPTTHKVASLSDNNEDADPSYFVKPQQGFNFQEIDANRKPVPSRILAELERDEIKDMAFKLARIVELRYQMLAPQQAELYKSEEDAIVSTHTLLALFVAEFGIKAPQKYVKQTDLSALQDISRMVSEDWWFGRLMSGRKIMREHLAIAMGQVSEKASPYASWDCIKEYKEQQTKNWDFIKQQSLFDEETQESAELSDMVLKSVANPAVRRHELMARCRGCEDIGKELGLTGLFLTLTSPSKYHNSYKKGGFIGHWNGASPRDTQGYLNKVWQRIRAKLARNDIRWFGIRVAEPHHDGTPHWHLLLWVKPSDLSEVRDIFINYATAEDRGELHPKLEREKKKPFRKGPYVGPLDYRARCDIKLIDPELGGATGYIAKYISKNIDGYGMDDEVSNETGKNVKEMAKNVSAWKSRWGIRQFQFFGGAPVTTYRELRRLASHNKKMFMEYLFTQTRVDLLTIYSMLQKDIVGPIKPSKLINNKELLQVLGDSFESRLKNDDASVSSILSAADSGNWQGYVMGQGGPFVKRADLLITNDYESLPFASPHGETVRKIQGIKTPSDLIKTRTKSWAIVPTVSIDALRSGDGSGFGSEATAVGASSSSRSSVNNCTGVSTEQIRNQLSKLLPVGKFDGEKPPEIDDMALNALLKGSSLKVDDHKSIKIRQGEIDEHGNVRPPRLVEVVKAQDDMDLIDEDWSFDDLQLADEPFDKPELGNEEYQQPDLSFFPELEGSWTLG